MSDLEHDICDAQYLGHKKSWWELFLEACAIAAVLALVWR